MASAFELDTRRFDDAMRRLSERSTRSNAEQIRLNAIDMLKSIVWNSPRRTGSMNAGWWPAWRALRVTGSPNTRIGPEVADHTPKKQGGRVYRPSGTVEDASGKLAGYIVMTNSTHMMDKRGKRVDYPHIVAARTGFMRRAEAEIAGKFEKRIEQAFRKDARRAGF